jgi:multidrug resistance efflux pump
VTSTASIPELVQHNRTTHTKNARSICTKSFLEIASVRVSLTDMVTTGDLRDHLDAEEMTAALVRLANVVESLSERIDRIENR